MLSSREARGQVAQVAQCVRRALVVSAPYQCQSTDEAAEAVHMLRDAGAWKSTGYPRKILVIVNPHSGRARHAHTHLSSCRAKAKPTG